jgi:hypothetical protein
MQALAKPFEDQWYVVALSEEIRTGKKKPVRLFGQEIVVWRHNDGHLGAIDSRCPHMGALWQDKKPLFSVRPICTEDARSEVLMEFGPHVVEYRKMRQKKLQEMSEKTSATKTTSR